MGDPDSTRAASAPERTAEAPRTPNPAPPGGDDFDAIEALMRLLVGGTLEGADELLRRLRQWEASTETGASIAPGETPADRRRYALVGLLAESTAWARYGVDAARRLSRPFARLLLVDVPAILRMTPAEPLIARVDTRVARQRATLDRWVRVGRQEERRGRLLSRRAVSSTMDELLDELAHNPELRELIEQQSAEVAGTAVDEVRERTLSADLWLEKLVHSMLRRSARERAPQPTAKSADLAVREPGR
jgi:hypothetical protein